MGQLNYAKGFSVSLHQHALQLPLGWKRPQMVFVNSMSDLFHEKVPKEFILNAFAIMKRADWHVFQVLTKRSNRLLDLSAELPWAPHIWMGVTVESQDFTFRIDDLRQTGANVKFLSIEPLLGPISRLDLSGIDWVIVGGESGPGARPMAPEWVKDIRDKCQIQNVRFFFKQWGGVQKKKRGRHLDGRTWDDMPAHPIA
jgi:protein gp37